MTASGNRPQATGAPIATWTVHGPKAGPLPGTAQGGPSTSPAMGFTIRAIRAEWPTFARTKSAMKARAAGAWHRPNGRGAGSGAGMGLADGLASHLHMAEEALDPWVFTGQQPGRWRIEQHAAAVHEQHTVGHAEGEAHLMRHDQHRHALARQRLHHFEHLGHQRRIERRCRLV